MKKLNSTINKSQNIEKEIKENGILSKGYGKTYKYVMLEPNIPIQSKAIYCAICSFSSDDGTAYPKKETLKEFAGIKTNKRYYKFLNILIDEGYIEISRRFNNTNIYLVKNKPIQFI